MRNKTPSARSAIPGSGDHEHLEVVNRSSLKERSNPIGRGGLNPAIRRNMIRISATVPRNDRLPCDVSGDDVPERPSSSRDFGRTHRWRETDSSRRSPGKQVTLLEAAPFDVSAAFPSGSGATRPGHTRANSRYRPPFGRGGQGPAARDVEGFFFRRLRSEDKAPSGGCSSKATDSCASGLGLRYLLANARASWLTAP